MATASIVKAWKDASNAYLVVSVNDGGTRGTVEYLGQTPLFLPDASGNPDPAQPKTLAQVKADLTAAVKAVRDAQLGVAPTTVGISGTVTV